MPLLKKPRASQPEIHWAHSTRLATHGSAAALEPDQLQGARCQLHAESTLSAVDGAVLSKPFKCPMVNHNPSGRRTGTLGARRLTITGALDFSQRLRAAEVSAPPGSAVPPGKPLLVFDPDDPSSCPARTNRSTLSKVEVEAFIAAKLRPHQAEGVQFMLQCLLGLRHELHSGCVLADGMGLGKTFQACAVLCTLLTTGVHAGQPSCKRPLILCPSSLVTNWGKEVMKWLDNRVDPMLCDDSRAAHVKETLSRFGGFTRKPQVLVMSFSTFRIHKAAVYQKHIDMVICDEAHMLKNGGSQITQAVAGLPHAKLRLLLTGTPIQNDLMEFFTLINLSVPGLLGELASFRKTYELPILRGQDADATERDLKLGQERSAQLLNLCNGFMLRRTSSMNKQYLPKCVEFSIFCHMTTLQRRLYSFFLASAPVRRALNGKAAADGADLHVLPAITALKKLCCHPDLVYAMSRPDGAQAQSSVVTGFEGCLPQFSEPPACPVYEPMGCQLFHSGKIIVLMHLLKAVREMHKTDKVVLVSNYTETLDLLGQLCTSHAWSFHRLDGSCDARKRQGIVDKFNDPADPSFTLLLSSKAGGTGLNIIGANRLVLMDPDWNPANDAQAMARVWREGQKKQVWIYRLLTTSSIEEKVYQRQLAKMGLSRRVVDDQANQTRHFSGDELRSLFNIDSATLCDTHSVIKCPCDGSRASMQEKYDDAVERKLLAMRQLSQASTPSQLPGDGGAGTRDDTLDAGIMAWAHLRDPIDSPDDVWQRIPSHIRTRYVSFMFSDHVLDPDVTRAECESEAADDEDEWEEAGPDDSGRDADSYCD